MSEIDFENFQFYNLFLCKPLLKFCFSDLAIFLSFEFLIENLNFHDLFIKFMYLRPHFIS